jgi:hypothetical protein
MEALSEERREAFRAAMRRNVLGDGADRPITLNLARQSRNQSDRSGAMM